jgi:hypothetical protein
MIFMTIAWLLHSCSNNHSTKHVISLRYKNSLIAKYTIPDKQIFDVGDKQNT